MSRRRFFLLTLFVAMLCVIISARSSCGITVGGWNSNRGGDSAILNGADFAGVRDDLGKFFPGVNVIESETLTTEFLNSLNVLLLDPVYLGAAVDNLQLSASEKTAFATWVNAGGRALVVGENFEYFAASNSMISPFGPQWGNHSTFGTHFGNITDHASFPAITDGPFGSVNQFFGGYSSWFDDVAPAIPLGTWDFGPQCLAALAYGSGAVVIFGDNTLLYDHSDNVALRRNTLTYLLNVAPALDVDFNDDGSVDAADYTVWRDTLGHSGAGLAADADKNGIVNDLDYDLWRANFGLPVEMGAGASVPEPGSFALLVFGLVGWVACWNNRKRR